MFVGMGANSGGGYNLESSLRFRSSATAYLSRTPATASNQKTYTYSTWVKRGILGSLQMLLHAATSSAQDYTILWFQSTDELKFFTNVGNLDRANLITTMKFRDPSAWYHIVLATDTTQATASNRVKMYVNGEQITAFSSSTYPNLNEEAKINSTEVHKIGANVNTNFQPLDGYMTEVNFIDGQALTPSDFGETDTITGVWKPKEYTGTYGTNGFYLNFSDSTSTTTLGYDQSPNSNNWTLNNISLTAGATYDLMNDVPTLTDEDTANYAVLNPLGTAIAPINGNLTMSTSNASYSGLANMVMPSGKWYWECVNTGGSVFPMFGIARISLANSTIFWQSSLGYAYYYDGKKYNASTPTSYGASYTANDIIGVAFDADAGTLTFYKNNVSQGVAFTGLTQGDYCPAIGQGSGVLVINDINFGQRPFAYTPPTGFKKLNTYNLPDSTIKDGSQYFDVVTYTGNATLGKVINTSIDFSTNGLAWFKARSNSAVISDWNNHFIVDSLRTFSGTPYFQILNSNSTIAESADGNILRDATSTSFQKGSGTTNENNIPYVGWLWQAGATSSSNTDGTITSTVSANTDSGFSVVTYTGAGTSAGTVGHGLGVAPKVVIAKSRDGARNWAVYHSSLGINYLIELNTTSAQINIPNYWGSVSPTSEVFGVYTANNVGNNNYLNEDMVAYCFAEVEGFSKIGSYTGNGSADGTFVYFGFRPKYIMIKRTDSTGDWIVLDAARYLNNPNGTWLYPNLSNAEGVLNDIGDILSNGYKNRNTQSVVNASGGTYIYMAFAENPFKQSLAR